MPTYTIYARAETFTGGQRDALARAVTAAHSEHTGAPRSFVQTIFRPVEPGTHYIGAEPADPRGVWVYGHIRRGRSPEVRTALAEGLTVKSAADTAWAIASPESYDLLAHRLGYQLEEFHHWVEQTLTAAILAPGEP